MQSIQNIDVVKFDWDPDKNKKNRQKHKVWFEEAIQVFDDTNALLFFDKEHSEHEDRFILLGSNTNNILVVIYCERKKSTVRINSARKVTKKEIKKYEEGI